MLYNKAHILNIHPDYFYIIHCPWCVVLHVSTVIDFDKSMPPCRHISSNEGLRRDTLGAVHYPPSSSCLAVDISHPIIQRR